MNNAASARFFFLIFLAIVLFVAFCGGCATPNSAWVAGGNRSAEVGVLAPLEGSDTFSLEASAERRTYDDEDCSSPLKPSPGNSAFGHSHKKHPKCGQCSSDTEEEILGRLGARLNLTDWAYVAAGLNTELDPYARLGLEQRLTREVAIGVSFLEDGDGQFLFGLRWSR
jgi:hypothetical protein